MDLEFTQEQEMLREMVRGVCAELAPMEVVRIPIDAAKSAGLNGSV